AAAVQKVAQRPRLVGVKLQNTQHSLRAGLTETSLSQVCCRFKHIFVLNWTRPGLGPDYVFLYRDQPDPESQHPSFKERVELKDSQMKDGDVSVTLKNVTFTDTGTYECRVTQGRTKAPELSTAELKCLFITYLTPHTCSLLQVTVVDTRMKDTRMKETRMKETRMKETRMKETRVEETRVEETRVDMLDWQWV
uniref:Ig-like domain-containing protein n=1 Tax=Mastacembelus armatus TaxID=205130 RepID=A0A7N8Y0X1_9TELE